MRDGRNKWWDVTREPGDLISFPQIKDWQSVSPEHLRERNDFQKILPTFDLHATEHDATVIPSTNQSPN